jgi:hypothetical protein
MTKFTFGAKLPNPAYDSTQPVGPSNLQYIYDNIAALDIGFSGANSAITDSITYWVNTNQA